MVGGQLIAPFCNSLPDPFTGGMDFINRKTVPPSPLLSSPSQIILDIRGKLFQAGDELGARFKRQSRLINAWLVLAQQGRIDLNFVLRKKEVVQWVKLRIINHTSTSKTEKD